MQASEEGAAVLRVRLCGDVEVEADGQRLPESLLAGRQGRLALAYLLCERHRAVPREELAELLWADRLPDSWTASLSAVISRLRRLLTAAGLDGATAIVSGAGTYRLVLPLDAWIDWEAAHDAVDEAERAVAAGDHATAVAAAAQAIELAGRGFLTDDCAWVDAQRDEARDVCIRALLASGEARLQASSPSRAVEAARDVLVRDPFREAGYRLLMRALAATGERAEALRTWERCRTTLVDELGIDPSPETESVYLAILGVGASTRVSEQPAAGATPGATTRATASTGATATPTALPSGVVTFVLTDIVESSALWERRPAAMATALERHDALVAEVVGAHGGTLLKAKLEGDATVSVFARATAGALAALAVRDAIDDEPWPEGAAPRVRVAVHTGEAFERAGDYFGPALNRAARLRSLAGPGEVLLSQAVAELVRDHLPTGITLVDRGHRDLRGLSRGENVYQLAPAAELAAEPHAGPPLARPPLPTGLVSGGPFVGRGDELDHLVAGWETALAGTPRAVLLAGEPGVGKSRLAAEWATRAHGSGAVVLHGGCDEEVAAPLQPFTEALRPLVLALGPERLRRVQGVDELGRVIPEVVELLPEASTTRRADPDTERYALFDAITRLVAATSVDVPIVLVLDDLHWAGKTTLTLLRHLLRHADAARLLVVGTYRDTELGRTHPLAATLADLHADGTADRVTLDGLGADEVAAYLEAVGHDDRALGRELARVTSGNPFFLIEALRHVEESGGTWEPGTLPQGVREATGRRLSRLSDAANDALSVAAVAGSSFSIELLEAVRGEDLIDPITEACRAGVVLEENGAPGRFRFAHALVRQVLLAELVTVKRLRLHRTIAELLESAASNQPDGPVDEHLTELAHHWFECAATGSADKAVQFCRRAADRAMERLAYDEAAGLYEMAVQALEFADAAGGGVGGDEGESSDGESDLRGELLLARCEALLTAGEVGAARGAIAALGEHAAESDRLAAWHATFAAQLVVLGEPERLHEVVESVGAAARAMQSFGDVTGEAKANYVHALALERLGQIAAAERALDAALAAARTAGDRRLADAVLAGAPQAALWGPSPVTRASGRCLDVVRVLRITAGAPAVEAVALRCQAALEALRGRMDAARRMVASSRRTVEDLGLAHRLLETEVVAGLIELLDGEAAVAEAHLRPAFEALRDRGLHGEAAQAAALLGRALLLQHRDDEAEEAGRAAEVLAGSDLKAAIAWRGVLAEAAARRGDTVRALELARAAVELASGTDALLLEADARLALAAVLRAAGDMAAADDETRRAAAVCDAKGASALADGARAFLAMGAAPLDAPTAGADDAATDRATAAGDVAQLLANDATRWFERFSHAWANKDWDPIVASLSDEWCLDDRQALGLRHEHELALRSLRFLFDADGVTWQRTVVATRGSRLALSEQRIAGGNDVVGPAVQDVLVVTRVDDLGRCDLDVAFGIDDLDAAYGELDRLFREGEAAGAAALWDGSCAFVRAQRARDFDAMTSAFAPGFEFSSHRSLGWGHLDARGYLEHLRAFTQVREDSCVRVRHVLAIEPNRSLMIGTNSDSDATEYELAFVVVTEADDDARLLRRDAFPLDHLGDAWRRYHEIGSGTPDAAQLLANDATRWFDRFVDAWADHDWDRVLALYSDDWRIDDRRTVGAGTLDHEQAVHSLRFLFEAGGVDWTREVVATRGSRLELARQVVVGGNDYVGPSRTYGLSISRVDADGRRDLSITFDLDDVTAAYDELDRLYEAGEGGPSVSIIRRLSDFWDAFRTADWPTARDILAEDFVGQDKAPIEGPRMTRAELEAAWPAIEGIAASEPARSDHVLRLSPTAGVTVWREHGAVPEGGSYESLKVLVFTHDGHRLRMAETYDLPHLDVALARYDELVASSTPTFRNAAVRNMEAFVRAFDARDWNAILACYAPDGEVDDRRALVRLRNEHAASERDYMRVAFDEGARWSPELLATRGDRLALFRTVITSGERWGAEFDRLLLAEVDESGRRIATVLFDLDDLEAAFDELYERHLRGEGSPHAARLRPLIDMLRRHNARDWDRFAEGFADDFVVEDHRPLGFVMNDKAGFLEYQRGLVEMVPDVRVQVIHQLAIGSRALLEVAMSRGTRDGGTVQTPLVIISTDDGGGAVRQWDVYELDQLDEARRRFDEIEHLADARARSEVIDCVPTGAVVSTEATRTGDRLFTAWQNKDFAAIEADHVPEHVEHDHRTIGAGDQTNAVLLGSIRSLLEAGVRHRDREVLATRGERLELSRNVFEFEWGHEGAVRGGISEVPFLVVAEVDDRGRRIRTDLFDVDDLDGAYDELDVRFARGEAAPLAAQWAARLWMTSNYGSLDLDRVDAAFADDFVLYDHRPLGWGTLDKSGYVHQLKVTHEVSPGARLRIDHVLGLTDRADMMITQTVGVVDGGAFEIPTVSVVEQQPDGRVGRVDFFPLDRLDDARRRFDEITASPAVAANAVLANAATRTGDEFFRAWRGRDWPGITATLAADHVGEDRRSFVTTTQVGDDWLDNLRLQFDSGVLFACREVLAIRGDRLELFRGVMTIDDEQVGSGEIPFLAVVEVDETGRRVHSVIFDPEDLGGAFDELNARYLAGEAAPFADAFEPVLRFSAASRARDLDTMRSTLGDDLVAVSHRVGSVAVAGGPDAAVDWSRSMHEVARDFRVDTQAVLVIDHHGVVVRTRTTGTHADGATFEFAIVTVYVTRAGRVRRIEQFDVEDVERARTRFEELRPGSKAVAPNLASLLWHEHMRRGDWRDDDPPWMAPDVVFEDHRALVGGMGRAELVATAPPIDAPDLRFELELVATAGEHLALERVRWIGSLDGGPFEVEFLAVIEVDEEGRFVAISLYDPDDRHAAFTDLRSREYARRPDIPAAAAALENAVNTRDLETLRETLHPAFVGIDLRHSGFGTTDREEFVSAVGFLVASTTDGFLETTSTVREDANGRLTTCTYVGTSVHGSEFEQPFLVIVRWKDDRIERLETFEPDDLDAALARYDELAGSE